MSYQRILVNRSAFEQTRIESGQPPSLVEGEVLAEVGQFALSANNISYAAAGDMLGYWNFFPAEDGMGCIPVWGFAQIIESRSDEVSEGEVIFGYFPMGTHLVLQPSEASTLSFQDASQHRAAMNPWYNRYYRCAADPAYSDATAELQPLLWALFMTGWMMADNLTDGTEHAVISSASSKTALSTAWSMRRRHPELKVSGLTSAGNLAFTEARDVYHELFSYDDVTRLADQPGKTAYIDIAGNAEVTSAAHVALADQLVDSVTIGSTHRAPGTTALPMPGPAPRFFFIPDVAEQQAAKDGFEHYHGEFAEAWLEFAAWSVDWIDIDRRVGVDAVLDAYQQLLSEGLPPQQAILSTWS